jgi:two-component system heavy metal sensor histidine kinase CusS
MSWKSVKSALFLKNSSITTRLTFFYAVAGFILLGIIALFLYWSMLNILYQNDSRFLSDEIRLVQYLLQKKPYNKLLLKHEINVAPFVLRKSFYHYFIRVIDQNNQIMFETPGMKSALDGADFFNKKKHWWYSKKGDKYLLMESNARFGEKIQAALCVSYQHAAIEQYRKRAVAILIIGELFAILIGYIIARRGLYRLRMLTHITRKITAASLHQRIKAHTWPKELRKLGLAFDQMLDRIETAFSHLIQFSDDLAHELRTPVNNLMGQTEIALSCDASKEEYQHTLESNLEDLQRISHIIENLLFLARAENPQLAINKTLLKAHDEIAVIIDFYQAMADDKKIKITCEGSADLHANQVMFRRMISNLLSNALKYTKENGLIQIFIKETPDNLVEIIIRDNGIGIAAEHLPKIFDRFYRVDPARSHATGSTGLGLAIVKSIIDLHHATISIHSEPEKGTIFILLFPK